MPAPERSTRDLSTVPSFLRQPEPRPAPTPARQRDAARGGALEIPRPATPPPAPERRPEPTLDPASLPMPRLSRRRVITAAGVLVAGLLVLTFARQVGDATAASNRAAELRAGNDQLRDDVARLEDDLSHVQDPRFIGLEGRAFGLGGPREIPFALAAGAPPLAANAPGSAAVRLGADPPHTSPLDAWLDVLFGAST